MPLFAKRLLFALLLTGFVSLSAQESSPYSRFGLGYIQDINTIPSSGMGGLGASFRSTEGVSYINPASYSALTLTGFEAGIGSTYSRLKTSDGVNTKKTSSYNANLQYLSLSLPIKKIWVISMGLLPYSVKDYRIIDTIPTLDTLSASRTFEGSGGMYNAYFGSGIRIKDFSLGFNVGYMFGRLENYVLATPLDTNLVPDVSGYSSLRINNLRVKGFTWNIGAQYEVPITKKIDLVLGISGSVSTKLSSKNELESGFFTIPNSFVSTYYTESENLPDFIELLNGAGVDTLQLVNENISVKLPGTVNAGFTFAHISNWKAGVDFRYQVWSKFEDYESNTISKNSNSWRIAAGGEWLPKSSTENSKFFQRVRYRAGLYGQRTNLEINGTGIGEFGFSFGFGLPVASAIPDEDGFIQRFLLYPFNFAFEAGSRGTTENGLVKENFFRMKFGLTLSDKWFVKRKYL